jgi:hypothetical protein
MSERDSIEAIAEEFAYRKTSSENEEVKTSDYRW